MYNHFGKVQSRNSCHARFCYAQVWNISAFYVVRYIKNKAEGGLNAVSMALQHLSCWAFFFFSRFRHAVYRQHTPRGWKGRSDKDHPAEGMGVPFQCVPPISRCHGSAHHVAEHSKIALQGWVMDHTTLLHGGHRDLSRLMQSVVRACERPLDSCFLDKFASKHDDLAYVQPLAAQLMAAIAVHHSVDNILNTE